MKILLPYHLGSGNRGCEGIARGIAKIFNMDREKFILYDISPYDYQSDNRLCLDQIGTLTRNSNRLFEIARLSCRVLDKVGLHFPYMFLMSRYYLYGANKGDYVFITGGDIYCYEGAYKLPNMIIANAQKKGIKTVLYGASIEGKYLNAKVIRGMKAFDLIISRESLSHEVLTKNGLKNELYPDPAFSLSPQTCELPEYFSKSKVIGINISPFTDTNGLFRENILNLIKYIVSQGMDVCFIPHVFWKGQDDRTSINQYKELMGEHVHVLDSERMSYLELRHAISKCEYFIGGRTHSVISAYSMHVPCIALGYSIKAKGIAQDIGLPEYTVVDSHHLENSNQIVNTFKKLENERDKILYIYEGMEQYAKKSMDTKKIVLEV